MTSIDLVIALDTEYIRRAALLASFKYPAVANQELFRGWSDIPVWPQLWAYVRNTKTGFPPPDDMVSFLLGLTSERNDGIECRAQKLVMDFVREVHAYALLIESRAFHYVSYQKILDLQYNIDFEVLPKGQERPVGIQAAMRASWNRDIWSRIHDNRRHRRGAEDWLGKLFWMTNRQSEAEKLPNRLWLFTIKHVQDVILEIKGNAKQPNLFNVSQST